MFDHSTTTTEIQAQDDSAAIKTFRRGIPATIAGLLHLILGFSNTLFSAARIFTIGYAEPFNYSFAIGFFSLSFESLSILLWISGIGILRAKRWGLYTGAAWASLTIYFHIASRVIRLYYWGDLAAPFGWGDYLVIYYALGFLAATAYIMRKNQ
jgi:hypothetical protein